MQEVHYLYKITNKVNGKLYIGVTKNPKHRKECHFSNVAEGRLVNNAVKKYGKDSLDFEIICTGEKSYIYDLEVKAILLYNSNATTGHGYNLCSGGIHGNSGNLGRKHEIRSDDVPTYVAGFWFPNKRTSLRSLNWGVGKYNGRKRLNILGETFTDFKKGPQSPTYVSGFWFPHKKKALEYLNISSSVYDQRRLKGLLGNVELPRISRQRTKSLKPIYYRNIWFPSCVKASEILSVKLSSLYRWVDITENNLQKINLPTKKE